MKTVYAEKLKNYKEKETLKERGTKRYQERIVEEQEAEEEIRNYTNSDYIEELDLIDNDEQHPTIS